MSPPLSPPLSPPARLGAQLALGALALILAASLFGVIAEDVVRGASLTVLDTRLAQWLHRHASARLIEAMLVVTNLHSTVAIACYAALAAAWFAWRRQWRRLTAVVVCVGGGLALNVLMKQAFHRPRPAFDDPLLTLATYSFPSGHVAASTIFYGLLVGWVFSRTRRRGLRALAVLGALAMIALVAFSRMVLGLHYLSDVAGAFAEGVAWLAICLGALAAYWHRAPAVR